MSVTWQVNRLLVDPEFADDVDACLSAGPYDWFVVQGFRTFEYQNVLYQKHLQGGPLAAPPGHSAHEHRLAVDVAENVDGRASWDESRPAWPWLWAAVLAAPRLHSGHQFPIETHGAVEADDDHIQSTRWPALRAQLNAAGAWQSQV